MFADIVNHSAESDVNVIRQDFKWHGAVVADGGGVRKKKWRDTNQTRTNPFQFASRHMDIFLAGRG